MPQNYMILILFLTMLPGIFSPGKAFSVDGQHSGTTGVIDWPVTGEHIQGAVVIRGSTPASGMRSYEVGYAQSTDPNQVWVLIEEGTTSIQNGILAIWDTTTIADGEYNLRLLINQTNGDQAVTNMYNLWVQNGEAIELTSITPTPWYIDLAEPTDTPTPSYHSVISEAYPSLSPSPTALPQNPAEISPEKALASLGSGALLSVSIFVVVGGYLGIRRVINNRK
jgi:hypothetical protein